MTKYEKTNVPNMVIDKATGAVLNTDQGGYQAIKRAREEQKKAQAMEDAVNSMAERLQQLETRICQLEEEIRWLNTQR